ncbi:MAG TPA: MOSC domain-containing protein [Candidatus Hydrogenedentes bacterium]|nr:MOSC domain-containing protein [Candidatus Hydrogenedentota bacterium]
MSDVLQEGRVVSVNVSADTGTVKRAVPTIVIDEQGIQNDAHAGPGHRQVSLLSQERIDAFAKEIGRAIRPGEFAENVTTQNVDLGRVALLDRLRVGAAELEVTQIGKPCHGEGCAIFREVGRCVMPKEGIFCRVIDGGPVHPGDAVRHVARPLRFLVITVSDRASRGQYEDRSGPEVQRCIEEHFKGKRWHVEIETDVLPDDAAKLQQRLERARDAGIDVIFTTGGTGVGPRDVTPDVVTTIADKLIPGIMEHIRVKYGADYPNALLSRGVAAVADETLVYALPGSVKAVGEYMSEILRTVEHAIAMLHGLGHASAD